MDKVVILLLVIFQGIMMGVWFLLAVKFIESIYDWYKSR